jgi:hypothetical protein
VIPRALAVLTLAVALAGALGAQDSAAVRWAQVTFVSGGQVYLSAGRAQGLEEGSEVDVVRRDSVVATLRVRYVSSAAAACDVVRATSDVAPGDRVRFVPTAGRAEPADTVPAAAEPVTPRRTGRRGGGLHGRVGVRYFATRVAPEAGRLSQPALDIRLAGESLGGSAFGVAADVRARSASSHFVGGATRTHTDTDVHQLALLWRGPGAPFRAVLGRQYVGGVSSFLLLDGVLAELSGSHVTGGMFGGAEPDGLALDAAGPVFGTYLRAHSGPRAAAARAFWAVTLGAVGSYRGDDVNREFAFLQATYSGPSLTVHGAQEVDLYRSVRLAAGERPLSFTSSYVSASLHPRRGLALDAGFDTRRNVRLYRDVTDPVAAFDDRYRQGARGGVGYAGRHVRARAEGRTTTGGGGGRATAFSGTLGLERIGPLALAASWRTTRYRTGELTGWLHAMRVGADPAARLHLELSAGLRDETNPPVTLGTRRVAWFGVETDVGISRSWFLVASASRENGPGDRLDQAYLSLTYRF